MRTFILQISNALKEKGNKAGVERQLTVLREREKDLQKDSNLSASEIELYNKLLTSLSQKEKEISLAESDIKLFQKLRKSTPLINNFEIINSFDSLTFMENSKRISELFNNLRIKTETDWGNIIDNLSNETNAALKQLFEDKNLILNDDVYKRGEKYNKDNKELQSTLKRIKEEEKVLAEINSLEIEKSS